MMTVIFFSDNLLTFYRPKYKSRKTKNTNSTGSWESLSSCTQTFSWKFKQQVTN